MRLSVAGLLVAAGVLSVVVVTTAYLADGPGPEPLRVPATYLLPAIGAALIVVLAGLYLAAPVMGIIALLLIGIVLIPLSLLTSPTLLADAARMYLLGTRFDFLWLALFLGGVGSFGTGLYLAMRQAKRAAAMSAR